MDDAWLRECLRFLAQNLKIHHLAIQELRAKNRALIDLLEKLQPGLHQGVEVTKERLKSDPDDEPYRQQFQQQLAMLDALIQEMGPDDGTIQ